MKHIIFYSGGLGSWMTAKRVVQAHGAENVICLFTDTLIEDEDLYRFLIETTQDIYGIDQRDLIELAKQIPPTGHETMPARKAFLTDLAAKVSERNPNFIWLNDGRDPWDIFRDVRFLGNSRLAQCSHIIKQGLSRKYIEANFKPEETVLYLGIDWTEEHRTKAPIKNWAPYTVEFPMCEEPLLTKIDAIKALEDAGIAVPRLYGMNFSHNNCFAGEERFITDKGLVSFKEKLGESVRVLGKGGNWKDATIQSFGVQQIVELKLRRYSEEKVIRTTASHRWFVRKGRKDTREAFTNELLLGDKLVSMFGKLQHNVKLSPVGIMHGITFGDGSINRSQDYSPACVTLCGEKQSLTKYFNGHEIKDVPDVGVKVVDLPKFFKKAPDLSESKSYLLGWLAGYFAADGSVTSQCRLSSAKKENLIVVRDVATILGIATNQIRTELRKGYGEEESELFTITFVPSTLDSRFFLRDKHLRAFKEEESHRPAEWQVVDVLFTGMQEEVFCAVVPDGNAFTLERNIHTSNCGGFCVRAGQGHFVNLLEKNPELYRYHEEKEQEMRDYLGKDVAMLRRTRNKVKIPLTLHMLREEVEANKTEQIDMFDIGGCGCFISDVEETEAE
jgi:hypothetical protein